MHFEVMQIFANDNDSSIANTLPYEYRGRFQCSEYTSLPICMESETCLAFCSPLQISYPVTFTESCTFTCVVNAVNFFIRTTNQSLPRYILIYFSHIYLYSKVKDVASKKICLQG